MAKRATLAERRRDHARADLHDIALRLAEAHGVDWVTADKVAEEAGISTRTFFNYFRNKEEAILGLPLVVPSDAFTLLEAREPAFLPLVEQFLRSIFIRLEPDRTRLHRVMQLIQGSDRLTEMRSGAALDNHLRITRALQCRYPAESEATCAQIAGRVTVALYTTRDLWLIEERHTLDEAIAVAMSASARAARLTVG